MGKLTGEHYLRIFASLYGLETLTLRYFNVFGPRQDPGSPYSGVISLFTTALLAGRTPVIYGDGHQSRDFTYVENVVRRRTCWPCGPARLRGPGRERGHGPPRHAPGSSCARWAARRASRRGREHRPVRAGDVRHSLADISRWPAASWATARRVDFEDGPAADGRLVPHLRPAAKAALGRPVQRRPVGAARGIAVSAVFKWSRQLAWNSG